MVRTELPSAPWQHLTADLLGALSSGDYVFVLVDYYNRFFEMEFTKSTSSEKIVSTLSKVFVTHCLPLSLRMDNGSQFLSDYLKKYLEGMELSIDEPHPYGHRQRVRLKDKTAVS